MRDIFTNPTQPLSFQADIVEIGPLTLDAVVELIADGFRRTGRRPGAAASLIHEFTGGHPLRTMQAAHAAWQHADADRADQRWGEAIASLRTAARPAVSGLYEQLATWTSTPGIDRIRSTSSPRRSRSPNGGSGTR